MSTQGDLLAQGADGNLVTISPSTAGYVLTDNGPGVLPSFRAGSGVTGISTYTSAFASPPATPAAGDLWLPSDGVALYRYSGTAWVPWGPLYPLTDPTLTTWAWVNQGGASVDTTNGGIYLLGPKGAANSWRIRKTTAPATPYKIDVIFRGAYAITNQSYCGILFRESGSGKLHIFTLACVAAGSVALLSTKWTNPTTFSADYKIALAVPWGATATQILRIEDTGVNRVCSYSADGQHFLPFHSVGRTDFLTADEVGFAVSDSTNTYDVGMSVLSWRAH